MPLTPAETNSPVLLDQARRYVDAEDQRIGILRTGAASLVAAVLVLVGITFTIESQFSNRDVPRWLSLAIAGAAMAALLIGAFSFVLALLRRRTNSLAPQTIRVLSAPGVIETNPVVLNAQLIATATTELDAAESETSRMGKAILIGFRWLAGGIIGVLALTVLFGVTHDKPVVQRVNVVAPIDARVIAPIQAKIITPVEARIVTPVHAKIVGQVRARIVTPITILVPPEDPPMLRRAPYVKP